MDPGKFQYFMDRTEADLEHIRSRVDKLWDFRIMMIGGSMVVSAICSALVSVAAIYFGAH